MGVPSHGPQTVARISRAHLTHVDMSKLTSEMLRELRAIVHEDEIPEGAVTPKEVAVELGLTDKGAANRLNALVTKGTWAKGLKGGRAYFWKL